MLPEPSGSQYWTPTLSSFIHADVKLQSRSTYRAPVVPEESVSWKLAFMGTRCSRWSQGDGCTGCFLSSRSYSLLFTSICISKWNQSPCPISTAHSDCLWTVHTPFHDQKQFYFSLSTLFQTCLTWLYMALKFIAMIEESIGICNESLKKGLSMPTVPFACMCVYVFYWPISMPDIKGC